MTEQPQPQHNDRPAIVPLVIEEIQGRYQVGLERYGTPLKPFNGRDSLRDLNDELLDGVIYLRQHREELKELAADLRSFAEYWDWHSDSTISSHIREIAAKYPFLQPEQP